MGDGLILKDEAYAVVGAAMEVSRVLGTGFLEAVYQEALGIELSRRNIPHKQQVPLPITYNWLLIYLCRRLPAVERLVKQGNLADFGISFDSWKQSTRLKYNISTV